MKNQWQKLLTPYRYTTQGAKVDQNSVRSSFTTDQDRILFSSSFRRLAKKTQVHPLSRNDHIHNRLSHSLEVACVARSLGGRIASFLSTNEYLPCDFKLYEIGEVLYAACLAHDIGNPPLGHAGESAIQDWFSAAEHSTFVKELSKKEQLDFQCFDGNAQGFRVVCALENNKDKGGLRLTYPTIASFVKYPNGAIDSVALGKMKFNFYQTEEEHFDMVFSELGLKKGKQYLRHPLAYLSEAADDICYRIIDIEDAHELKIISFDEIFDIIQPVCCELRIDVDKIYKMDSDRRRLSMLRTLIITKMIDSTIEAYIKHYDEIMEGEVFSIIDKCDESAINYMQNAKEIFYKKIMYEPQKIALEIGSYNLYKVLLDVFIPATFYKVKGFALSFRDNRALDLMGVNAPLQGDNLNAAYHRVIDFITGMTDNYATFISTQFSGVQS